MRQDIASNSHDGRKCAVFVFAAFLLLTGGNAHAQGSVETDRAALVALYNATGGANWTNNTNWLSTEALSEWYGTRTDANGRVVQLSLIQNELSGTIPAALGDLTHLQKLFLMQNMLSGTIPVELGNMTSLLVLALDQNMLSGTIPVELGNMTSLQQLSLSQNTLSGTIPVELGDLTHLQILYLYANGLSGTIPAELGDLTNLRHLYFQANKLSGEIPAELGNLTNLQQLYLWSNTLSGTIPAELGDLTSLQFLYLSRNMLSGTIPAELGDLTSLQFLYLSRNMLSGTIPAELGDLTSLQFLYLNENMLSGAIPAELGDLTNLQRLSLWSNTLSGTIPAELGDLTSLQFLYLNENMLSGAIPAELGDLTSLQRLYLSRNTLSGTIPAELGDLTSLQFLYLNENMLSGAIPAELGDLTNLQRLSLWSNTLSGTIPAELGDLTSLQFLYLNENMLSGAIPAELGDLTSLQRLYLSRNTLSGTIPAELGDLTSLQFLYLNENMLSGAIPAELGDLTNLQRLSLWSNTLSGTIPAVLGNLTNLQILYLNENMLSEPLPLTLSALSQLSVLDIRSTNLCAPADTAFQAWLATITFRGSVCGATRPPGGGGGGGGPRLTAPEAPRNLTAAGGIGEAVLAWDAPEDDGGSAIRRYEYRINGEGRWISIGSTHTTHTVTGLTNSTVYVFQVRAVNRIGESRASNRAEATLPVVLDFAHFANGTGITSDLVLLNLSTHPIQPALYFYDQMGHLIDPESVVDLMDDLEIAEDGSLTVRTEMEPLGELTISTHGRGEPVSGSVKVVSSPIGGGVRYNVPEIGVAGVGASPPVRDVIFPARRQEGGVTTAAALHNLGEEPMGVRCRLMRGGVALEEVEILLEANGQTSGFIEEVFTATDTSDFVGSVRCAAPGRRRFSAVALEMDPGTRTFTTLPVVEVNRGRPEATTLGFAHFANGMGSGNKQTAVEFAHYTTGPWITDLVFVNLETRPSGPPLTPFHTVIPPTRPVIYFYDTAGNPIAAESVVDITDNLEVTEDGALTVRTEMEPLGVLTISTHGRGELLSGSVKVVSDGPIGGMLRFDHPDFGVAGVGASLPLSDALFPVRRQEGGITTGVALHNLESSPGLVRCELRKEGVLRDAASIPLAANGQTAWFIDQAFLAADTSDFSGSVRCAATGEGLFTAVALEMDPGNHIFTTLPVVPVIQ